MRAKLIDVDGGEADRFAAQPSGSTCMGTRGSGLWVDSTNGAGIGCVGP